MSHCPNRLIGSTSTRSPRTAQHVVSFNEHPPVDPAQDHTIAVLRFTAVAAVDDHKIAKPDELGFQPFIMEILVDGHDYGNFIIACNSDLRYITVQNPLMSQLWKLKQAVQVPTLDCNKLGLDPI